MLIPDWSTTISRWFCTFFFFFQLALTWQATQITGNDTKTETNTTEDGKHLIDTNTTQSMTSSFFDVTTLSDVTNNSALPVRCDEPDVVVNGSYHVNNNVAVFVCDPSFALDGHKWIMCLANGSWSGDTPKCRALNHADNTERPVYSWARVFADNRQWAGAYIYDGRQYSFHLYILDIDRQPETIIHALCVAQSAKFDAKGYSIHNGTVFEMSRLLKHNDHFTNIRWKVTGHLTLRRGHWTYRGLIDSDHTEFGSLVISPYVQPTGHPHDNSEGFTSVTGSLSALVIGIVIAMAAIMMAAILAAFCVRRRHTESEPAMLRSLSISFENPVYDYDNSLLVK